MYLRSHPSVMYPIYFSKKWQNLEKKNFKVRFGYNDIIDTLKPKKTLWDITCRTYILICWYKLWTQLLCIYFIFVFFWCFQVNLNMDEARLFGKKWKKTTGKWPSKSSKKDKGNNLNVSPTLKHIKLYNIITVQKMYF